MLGLAQRHSSQTDQDGYQFLGTSHEITPDEFLMTYRGGSGKSKCSFIFSMGKFPLSSWNVRPSRESLQEELPSSEQCETTQRVPKHTGWLMGSPHGFMIFPHL